MREKIETLRTLVAKLCDAELSQEDRDILNDLLRESPALRREYTLLMAVHSNLITHSALPEPITTLRNSRAKKALLAAVALGTLSLICLLVLPVTKQPSPAPGFVSVIRTIDCDWAGRSNLVEGSLLGKSKLQLTRGQAALRFPEGVEINLTGPAELEITGPAGAKLHKGQLHFSNATVEDEAFFTLLTPQGEVLDIGTSYSVLVDGQGSEEIHVDEGRVIRTDDTGSKTTVNAGEAMRWDARGSRRSIPFVQTNAYRRTENRATKGKPIAWYSFTEREGYGYLESWAAWGESELETRNIENDFTQKGFQPSERSVIAAPLKEPIDLRENDVTYFSLHADIEDASRIPKLIYFAFRESDSPDHKAQFMMVPKRRTIGAHLLHSDQDSAGRSTMALALPGNNSSFQLAGKIVSQASEPDQVFLRILPEDEPLDSDEPFAWSVIGKRIKTDFRFDIATIHLNTNGQIAVSDLNLGKTWQSVTKPLRK